MKKSIGWRVALTLAVLIGSVVAYWWRGQEALKKSPQTNHEAKVTQIGQVWQREHRGTSNFAKFQWEKNQ